jgi:hypothetical protein
MIHAAFTAARQDSACASDGSLSKQEIVDRYCIYAQLARERESRVEVFLLVRIEYSDESFIKECLLHFSAAIIVMSDA